MSPSRNAVGSADAPQAWFAGELKALKVDPEDVLSPTSPQNLEAMSAVTPYTPPLQSLQPVLPTGQLKLPLTKEMALSVDPHD